MVRIESINEPLTIKIDRSPKVHDQADAIEDAWQGLCTQNPRYFNGQMLAFDSYDPSTGVIHASVEQYKHHAVRDTVDVGISLLAVTAILGAPDHVRNTCVYLLGKRSPELHRYGGLWELGPSGGVDVPADGNTIDQNQVLAEAAREVYEEVGLNASNASARPIVLVHDDAVGSTDIAIGVVLDQVPNLKTNWEYTETTWMTLDELFEWAQTHPEELIPTTVELARHLYESRDAESAKIEP